jgi:hypothetical protein
MQVKKQEKNLSKRQSNYIILKDMKSFTEIESIDKLLNKTEINLRNEKMWTYYQGEHG